MRGRFSLTAVSYLILLAVAMATPRVWAQALDVFVTPIPHAPFTGVIHVERSIVQRNGSVTQLKTIREIGRDSLGRIHNESRELLPVSSNKTPQVVSIHLYDPQTRISTVLNPKDRTFWTMAVNRPPATVPPSFLNASPTGATLPRNEFTKQEDLGMREMEGGPVHGVRETQTIPAASSGAGKEITVVDEYWYSDDLRINLMISHSDPRTGSVRMTVAQVSRAEPDAAFFEVSGDYKTPKGAKAAE